MAAARVEGCWTCKSRRKRCDGRKPTCRECERLNRVCKGYQKRILWEDEPVRIGISRRGFGTTHPRRHKTSRDTPEASTPATPLADVSTSLIPWPKDVGLSGSESILLDWYISQFATSYPRYNTNPSYPSYNAPQNPFLYVLLPMAFESPSLMRAVLALAGTQACLSQPSLRPTTLQCRSAALKSLRESVFQAGVVQTKDAKHHMLALACAMSLFLYEKIECSEHAMRGHLTYAGVQVRNIARTSKSLDASTNFLFYLFAHNDIYSSIAFDQPLIIDSLSDVRQQFLDSDTFLGILAAIRRISSMKTWTEKMEAGQQLLQKVERWEPRVACPQSFNQPGFKDSDFAGEVFKTAAYVSLCHTMDYTPRQERVHQALDTILSIESSDPVRPSLLWPAVVIGVEASDFLQRIKLQEHLVGWAKDTGFRQYRRAIKLLEDCWLARDIGLKDSWVDIMHHSGEIILCAL